MTLLELKHELIKKIRGLPVCIPNSSYTQWTVRCPYCGDSRTSSHGHFSIKINTNSDDLCVYRCLKCNEAGILSSTTLNDLGIYMNREFSQSVDALNKPSGKSDYFRSKPKIYRVPTIIKKSVTKPKLDYLQSRIGVEFTSEVIQQSKVILSIVDFLAVNKLSIPDHIDPNMINILEENYVGFLSANNNKITFRRITDNSKLLRYYKFTVDPYNTSPNNFYSMKNEIDLLYTGPVNIHIAEGTFDITSIYYNLNRDTSQPHLFFAACGYNFATILKYLIFTGVNTDMNVFLYSDKDKSDFENLKVLNSRLCKIWVDHAYICRNGYPDEKDFGVPPDRIQTQMIKIR